MREALLRQVSLDLPAGILQLEVTLGADYSPEVLNHASRCAKVTEALIANVAVNSNPQELVRLLARSFSLSTILKDQVVDSLPRLSQQNVDELMQLFEREFDEFSSLFGPVFELVADALEEGDLGGNDDLKGAVALFDTCDNAELQYVLIGLFTNMLDSSEFAYCSLAQLPRELGIPSAEVMDVLGDLLVSGFKRHEESEQLYRRAIEIDVEDEYAWNGLGIKLQPYVTAVRAFYLDEAELRLVRPEVRLVAEPMYKC